MPPQVKSPSLARDLLTLGDIYLTLAWLAYQRLRHGPLWPWDAELGDRRASVVTLRRPRDAEERPQTVTTKRG